MINQPANEWTQGRKKYALYTILCLAYFCNGIDFSIIGPSVKDLAALYKQTNIDNTLLGLTIRGISMDLGHLFGWEILMFSIFGYFISVYLDNYLNIRGIENTNLIALESIFSLLFLGLNVLFSLFKVSTTNKSSCKYVYASISMLLVSIGLLFCITPSTPNRSTLLSISMILLGVGNSVFHPNVLAFIEQRINITTKLNSSFFFVGTAGFCVETYILSSKMKSDPVVFMNRILFYVIALAILFILLHLTDFVKKYFLITKKLVNLATRTVKSA